MTDREYARAFRCPVCRVGPRLCVCSQLPRIELPFELLLLQHARERIKQSNTGSLAAAACAPARIRTYGSRTEPFAATEFEVPGHEFLVLFPHPAAQPLTPELLRSPQPRSLLVLDGTWPQARRMMRRLTGLAGHRFVTLPPHEVAQMKLRQTPTPGFLNTIEAIAAAFRALGLTCEAAALAGVIELALPRMEHVRSRRRLRDIPGFEDEPVASFITPPPSRRNQES